MERTIMATQAQLERTEELEQAHVLIDKLTAERNNARLVAQANKEAAEAWKQRYLALMAETRELRQAAEAWE